MADEREDLIRNRAYELWEAEGTPHGRHDDHWSQASRELAEAQEEAAAEPAPVTRSDAAGDGAAKRAPAKSGARKASAAPAAAPKGRRKKDG